MQGFTLSTIYPKYQVSKDDLKSGLFWNMDPVFRLKGMSISILMHIVDIFEVV